ncbi:hypothetical protein [Paenibacillus sp. RC21]|uniref:hypothetical protein n=1 Tax=Paenibacillus sp. RC21 TaxID=3156312 RepID=UPI003832949E
MNTKGKRDQGIMDESTLILHAKSWTTPKKIRHDRFRSPGPVMADLLCSHFSKALLNQAWSLNGVVAVDEDA